WYDGDRERDSLPTRRSSDLAVRRRGKGRRMDVVGVEGEAAAGSAGGVRAVPAGPVGECEREPHPSDSLRTFGAVVQALREHAGLDRKSTRLNSSHVKISYAV